jgi:hypothetical protein
LWTTLICCTIFSPSTTRKWVVGGNRRTKLKMVTFSGYVGSGDPHPQKPSSRRTRACLKDLTVISTFWKVLITLLSSKDEVVVSIACYDVGKFVRFDPGGRAIVKRLARSQRTHHASDWIRKPRTFNVMLCNQYSRSIMVHNWEYVK